MSAKPTKRNWNDVQTAIATAAIVTTLGMWNLFAAPAKTATAQAEEPTLPPTEPPASPEPAALPYVKVMFTPMAPETTTVVQQSQQEAPKKKKKKEKRKRGSGGGGGGAPVTNTGSS